MNRDVLNRDSLNREALFTMKETLKPGLDSRPCTLIPRWEIYSRVPALLATPKRAPQQVTFRNNNKNGRAATGLEQANEDAHYGVGDVPSSWGVNGVGEEDAYPCRWKPGNVIGLAVDLAAGESRMLVSVDGSYDSPNGVVFKPLFDTALGLFPAVSLCAGQCWGLHSRLTG